MDVVWNGAQLTEGETELEIVLRQCDAFIADPSCSQFGYRDTQYSVIKTITAAEFESGRTSFPLPSNVPRSDHNHISIESKKFHASTIDWPYVN